MPLEFCKNTVRIPIDLRLNSDRASFVLRSNASRTPLGLRMALIELRSHPN